MDENVLARLPLDESKAFAGVKPLDCSLFFQLCFSFLFELFGASLPLPPAKKRPHVWRAVPSKILKVFLEQQTQHQCGMDWVRCPVNSVGWSLRVGLGWPRQPLEGITSVAKRRPAEASGMQRAHRVPIAKGATGIRATDRGTPKSQRRDATEPLRKAEAGPFLGRASLTIVAQRQRGGFLRRCNQGRRRAD